VRLLKDIGVDTAIRMARDLGIESPIERNLSIALGSSGITPLEMVTAYATFANGGRRTTPFFIREVQDASGSVLERTETKVVAAIPPETAFLTIRLMQEVLRSGTAVSAKGLSPNLAGKTGTTNENTDAWFIGGSPDLMAGVWVGFDTPASLGDRQSAATVALPIWMHFMRKAMAYFPDREFPPPAGVTFARVDPATGKAVPQGSGEGLVLPFKLGTVPEVATPAGKPAGPRRGVVDDLL
jgi:penicillin-binding protein 1A